MTGRLGGGAPCRGAIRRTTYHICLPSSGTTGDTEIDAGGGRMIAMLPWPPLMVVSGGRAGAIALGLVTGLRLSRAAVSSRGSASGGLGSSGRHLSCRGSAIVRTRRRRRRRLPATRRATRS